MRVIRVVVFFVSVMIGRIVAMFAVIMVLVKLAGSIRSIELMAFARNTGERYRGHDGKQSFHLARSIPVQTRNATINRPRPHPASVR